MPRKSYDKMYEEKNVEAAPVEEPKKKKVPAAKEVPDGEVKESKKSDSPMTKPFMGTVIGGLSLNVRKAPEGTIISSLSDGAQVKVLDDSNPDWYKIESPEGYVMKQFIRKD